MTAPLNMSLLFLSLQTFVADAHEGFLEITRNSLALIGLVAVVLSLTLVTRPDLQVSASEALLSWLEIRQIETLNIPAVDNASSRSTAKNIHQLTEDQLAVTHWLSRKYRVSLEPMGAMVSEAWVIGERSQLPPSLILAIIAIESRFNPYASGSQGAVGLMQIEQHAHSQALDHFGGRLSAFDPLTNLRIGVRHLQALVQQTSTLEQALSLYGASSGQATERQYVERVLAEQQLLENISEKQKTAALTFKGHAAQL